MINIKIDVNKIDKSKLYKGEKGNYLNLVLIETPNNQYGHDYMAVQSVSKEEREQGIKGNILGNGKTFVSGGGQQTNEAPAPTETDDLPW